MKKNPEIRRSQFIRTYGPGAILETEGNTVIIKTRPAFAPSIENYTLKDGVLNSYIKGLLKNSYGIDSSIAGVDVYEIPYSGTGNVNDSYFEAIYFQKWYLCSMHGYLWHYSGNNKCPACKEEEKFRYSRPVRFVMACENGHLDDIDWAYHVHSNKKKGKKCTNKSIFKWKGGTGTVSSIEIVCEDCNNSISLSEIFGRKLKCSGKIPEKNETEECSKQAKVTLRMASSIRIPETHSVFMVWPRSDQLGLILSSRDELRGSIKARIEDLEDGTINEDKFREKYTLLLQEYVRKGGITQEEYNILIKHKNNLTGLKERIDKLGQLTSGNLSMRDILDLEFDYLRKASFSGAVEKEESTGRKYFEVNSAKSVRYGKATVCPLDVVTAVEVQIAYRRMDAIAGKPVLSAYVQNNRYFFPGIRLTGEGIYFHFSEIEPVSSPLYTEWMESFKKSRNYYSNDYVFKIRDEKYELHPNFVILHTLSHLIIKALSLYSGYSASSLREKVYISKNDGYISGGIVIYASSEDEGGTMGGLVSLVNRESLKELFRRVEFLASSCSNDPLCSEKTFRKGEYSGASCYSCTLLPETSCDYRNLWLDRNLLNENFRTLFKNILEAENGK